MSPVRPSRGPSDMLFVEDIRFYGHHGVTPAQQEVGAWFSVDVELALDLTPAALSDDLDAGVDYGQVVQRVVAVGTGERVHLIERLAGLLCEALLREYPARERHGDRAQGDRAARRGRRGAGGAHDTESLGNGTGLSLARLESGRPAAASRGGAGPAPLGDGGPRRHVLAGVRDDALAGARLAARDMASELRGRDRDGSAASPAPQADPGHREPVGPGPPGGPARSLQSAYPGHRHPALRGRGHRGGPPPDPASVPAPAPVRAGSRWRTSHPRSSIRRSTSRSWTSWASCPARGTSSRTPTDPPALARGGAFC